MAYNLIGAQTVIKLKKKITSMANSKVCGQSIMKRLVLKKKRLTMWMGSKKAYGPNGLKMVKKEEKEILKKRSISIV